MEEVERFDDVSLEELAEGIVDSFFLLNGPLTLTHLGSRLI